MSHRMNQKGFAAVEAVLIVIIVGLLAGAGYYVWHANRQVKTTLDNASGSAQVSTKAKGSTAPGTISGLSLDTGKLPDGWTASSNNGKRVVVGAADKSCTVAAVLITLTPQHAADADAYFKQQLGASSGNTDYSKLPTTTLNVHASAGDEKVTAYRLNVTLGGVTANQNIGFLAKGNSYVGLTQSCINTSDFTAANQALAAITAKD